MLPKADLIPERKIIKIAGTILALLLLVWLLIKQDWALMKSYLNDIPIFVIFLALIFYLLGQILNANRWYILLKEQGVPINYFETAKIVFSGAFASNFLPTTIGGDVVRLVKINRLSHNQGMNIASILIDRLINMAAFFTVLPFSMTVWLAEPVESLLPGSTFFMIPRKKMKSWFEKSFKQFIEAYQLWSKKPISLINAFITSWFSIFVVFIALWILASALGINIKLVQVMGITSMTYFITLLPISINGYGLRELTITFFYMRLGASAEQASMLAIISRFLMMLVTVPGVIWLNETSRALKHRK